MGLFESCYFDEQKLTLRHANYLAAAHAGLGAQADLIPEVDKFLFIF